MKKIALVTGASRGIGKAAALALACDGWTVHVNYIQSQAAAEAVAAQTGGLAIRADVSDAQAVAAMFEQTGPVDLLVNNAGIAVYGLLTDLDPDVWQRLFDVNVTGTYNCCRFAIPPMVHEKAGHIINLTSILGMNGASCEAAYSATKGAIVAFTKAMAKELGPSGIRVNCVAPGCIDTDMIANLSPEDKAELAESTSLGRMGTAEEVGDAIALLASERARFVTGQVFGGDGGLLLCIRHKKQVHTVPVCTCFCFHSAFGVSGAVLPGLALPGATDLLRPRPPRCRRR